MPALIAVVLRFLVPVLGWVGRTAALGMVLRVLAGLGLGFGTYKLAVVPFLDYVRASAAGVSSDLVGWLGVLRFDIALTMIMSAVSVRATMSAVKLFKKA